MRWGQPVSHALNIAVWRNLFIVEGLDTFQIMHRTIERQSHLALALLQTKLKCVFGFGLRTRPLDKIIKVAWDRADNCESFGLVRSRRKQPSQSCKNMRSGCLCALDVSPWCLYCLFQVIRSKLFVVGFILIFSRQFWVILLGQPLTFRWASGFVQSLLVFVSLWVCGWVTQWWGGGGGEVIRSGKWSASISEQNNLGDQPLSSMQVIKEPPSHQPVVFLGTQGVTIASVCP